MKDSVEFTKRLKWCMDRGSMTVADLHHWFGRPRATVRTWAVHKRKPQGPSSAKVHLLLAELERKIKRKQFGFPIPADLSAHDRPTYVKKLRHATGARLSATRPAGGGV